MPPRTCSARGAAAAAGRSGRGSVRSPSPRRPGSAPSKRAAAAAAAAATARLAPAARPGNSANHTAATGSRPLDRDGRPQQTLPSDDSKRNISHHMHTNEHCHNGGGGGGVGPNQHYHDDDDNSNNNGTSGGGVFTSLSAAARRCRKTLVSIHEVDSFLQFNRYVRRGYRPSRLTVPEALGSIFLYLHNETVNVATHMFLVVVFAYLMVWPPIPPMFAELYGAASEAQLLDIGPSDGDGDGVGVGDVLFHHRNQDRSVNRNGNSDDNNRAGGRRQRRPGSAAAAGPTDPSSTVAGTRTAAFIAHEHAGNSNRINNRCGGPSLLSRLTRGVANAMDIFPGCQRRRRHRNDDGVDVLDGDIAGNANSDPLTGWWRWLTAPFRWLLPPTPAADPVRGVFLPLCFSFLCTFILSSAYHTFMPCCSTRKGYHQLLQCDVTGVLTSITGSAYVYFVRGNPCVSPTVIATAAVVMSVSTACTLYALVLAPLGITFGDAFSSVGLAVCDFAAAALLVGWEWLRGGDHLRPSRPLSSSSSRGVDSDDAVVMYLLRARQRTCRRLRLLRWFLSAAGPTQRSEGNHSINENGNRSNKSSAAPALTRGRIISNTNTAAAAAAAAAGEEECRPPARRGDAAAAAAAAGLPPQSTMTAGRRAAIATIHCGLHFGCYLFIVVPKRSAGALEFLLAPSSSFSPPSSSPPSSSSSSSSSSLSRMPTGSGVCGYSQAVYFHGLSYLLLLVGGVLNGTRQPERLVWAMTRRARSFERRRMEREGERAVAESRRNNINKNLKENDERSDIININIAKGKSNGGGNPERARHSGGHARSSSSLLLSSSSSSGSAAAAPGTTVASMVARLCPLLPRDDSGALPSWPALWGEASVWWPAAACYYFTRYCLSNRELDFVGNSHTLWHLASGLSAVCAVMGAYYDIVEWELMAPLC